MSTSLNGWPGIPSPGYPLATGIVPGTARKVTLQKDVLPLFLAFLHDWHLEVMPIDGKQTYLGPDGWAYRQARTGAGLSCHASGTAVDVRYDVLKADHQRHMTAAQITAVHRLLDKYVDSSGRRVFGWGGDWHVGTFCDEMHTELAQGWAAGAKGRPTVASDVAVVIARLRIQPDGTVKMPSGGSGGQGTGVVIPGQPVVVLADLRPLKSSESARIVSTSLSQVGYWPASAIRSRWSLPGFGVAKAFATWRASKGFTKDQNREAFEYLGRATGFTVV